jgi:hypothetical protein
MPHAGHYLNILEQRREKARVASRFITDEYWAPLGVWVVREATRNCFAAPSLEFESKELMIKYASIFLRKKFNVSLDPILRKSRLLEQLKSQRTLFEY